MRCPQCGERETRVVDSRDLDDSATIRRRRECAACSLPVHDLRAGRGRPADRRQARRGAPGVRSRAARLRPAQGADPSPGRRRRRRGGRRRDRGRAPLGRRHRGAVVADRGPRHGAAPRASTRSPTSGSPASTRASRTSRRSSARWTRSTPSAGSGEPRPSERPVRSRHPGGPRGRQRSASGRTTRTTCSPRRSTCTSTAASGSSATTATRSSTSAPPQPDLTELLTIEDDEPFILHPGEFVLGQTLEWVELPDDLVARLEGK